MKCSLPLHTVKDNTAYTAKAFQMSPSNGLMPLLSVKLEILLFKIYSQVQAMRLLLATAKG